MWFLPNTLLASQILSIISDLFSTETYIFHISPKKDKTSLVASPGWPGGMKASSTASWIATFPEKMDAQLTFLQVNQPKCSSRHTSIQVKTLDSEEEMYSRREDEEGESEIEVPESFYLNVSNCLPERDSFSVMAEITLKKQKSRTTRLCFYYLNDNIARRMITMIIFSICSCS